MPVKYGNLAGTVGVAEPDALGHAVRLNNGEITGACAPAGRTGTAIAIIDTSLDCAPTLRAAHRFQHGGARNSAARASDGLTLQQSQKLIEAASTACKIGRPLNCHITVHWERAGIADERAAKATTAFLKYWREWLGGETAYRWARKNGASRGSHVHNLAHIPAARHWHGARAMRWIARLSGKALPAGRNSYAAHQGRGHFGRAALCGQSGARPRICGKGRGAGRGSGVGNRAPPWRARDRQKVRDQSQHRISSTMYESGGGFRCKSR